MVKNTDEWILDLPDPYWLRQVDALKVAGIPNWIAKPALIKTERELTARVAYA